MIHSSLIIIQNLFQKRNSLESVEGFNLSSETKKHDNEEKINKPDLCPKNIKELKNNYEKKIILIETRNKSVKTSAKEDRVIILDNEVGESNTDEAIHCSNSPEEVVGLKEILDDNKRQTIGNHGM